MSFRYPEAHDNCVLIRLDDAHFVAYGSKCTHLSCAVIPDVAAGVLHCPCHQGSFDLSSGRPLAGPPRRPLPRVQLKLQAGYVHAVGIEERTT
jgi:Rieske Fe-S protein